MMSKCDWMYDTWDGAYNSSCGQGFIFNYTRSYDPEFIYCPYCGKEIEFDDGDDGEGAMLSRFDSSTS